MKKVAFIILVILLLVVALSACSEIPLLEDVAYNTETSTSEEIVTPDKTQTFEPMEQITPKPIESEMSECINEEDSFENANDMEINIGVIYGNIYYNGVAISRLFEESFIDVFGEPLSNTENMHFYYEGLVVSVVVEYGEKEKVHQLTVSYVDLLEINNVSLDMSSNEFASIFGFPNRVIGDNLFIYYVTNHEITYTLTLELHEYYSIKKIVGVRLFPHNW